MPVVAFRVASRTDRSKGPNGDTKYTIIISVKKIKGLSVNRAGEGKGFRKSPSSHNPCPRGRSLADRSVHCRNTIRGCDRHSNLEKNTTEEEIGGRKAPARLWNRRCYFKMLLNTGTLSPPTCPIILFVFYLGKLPRVCTKLDEVPGLYHLSLMPPMITSFQNQACQLYPNDFRQMEGLSSAM